MHVTVIEKVNNTVLVHCRVIIRDFLTSVHMVGLLFICNIFMVVFEAQH